MEAVPNTIELLARLEESSNQQRRNIDSLFNQTCRSIEILEPWNHATSKHPEAQIIIDGVRKSAAQFVNAMIRSQDIARRGAKISKEMIVLCDKMLGGTTKSEELEIFITEMVPPAADAVRQSEDVRKAFQDVRTGLYMTTNKIPGIVAKIEAEEAVEMRKIQSATNLGESAKFFKSCGPTLVAVLGVVAAITCPPILIFLPIALPLIDFVADALEKGIAMRISVRESRVQNCQDAIETLEQAASDLARLDEFIDEFSSFWTSVKGLLDHVIGQVEGLRGSLAFRMRLKSIGSNWADIAQSYQDYAIKVQYLCEIASAPSFGDGFKTRKRNFKTRMNEPRNGGRFGDSFLKGSVLDQSRMGRATLQ